MSSRPDGFTEEFYRAFKEDLQSNLKLSLKKRKKETEETHSNCFYKNVITIIPNQATKQQQKENNRQKSMMNIDSKILNSRFISRIQTCIKTIIYHDQGGFIPKIQGRFKIHKSVNVINHINGVKDKNDIITLIEARKALDKIQHAFIIKVPDNEEPERITPQHNMSYIQETYSQHHFFSANIILSEEKFEAIQLK